MDMRVHPEAQGLTAEERALLDRLVVDMGPRLLAYVRSMRGRADAEELVAETFSRAADNAAALRASTRPEFYLLTIARNLCRDEIRRDRVPRARRGARDGEQAPDDLLAAAEENAALRVAVAELPAGLREVVVLRVSGGLRFEEVAELLRIPLGTALSRMHAAVRRLREKIGHVRHS
jgi:RNA polymerase sigma-70 factor (ECF subfamily)